MIGGRFRFPLCPTGKEHVMKKIKIIAAIAFTGFLLASCAPTTNHLASLPDDSIAEIVGDGNKHSNFPKLEESWAHAVMSNKAALADLKAGTPASTRNLDKVFGDSSRRHAPP